MTRKKHVPHNPERGLRQSARQVKPGRSQQNGRTQHQPIAASKPPSQGHSQGRVMIWGRHAVAAAIANSQRRLHSLHATADAMPWLEQQVAKPDLERIRTCETVFRQDLDRMIATGAGPDTSLAHQGVVLNASPLQPPLLADFINPDETMPQRLVLLDQITDPRNIGAIFRAAAAFHTDAIIATERHCPAESGVMLKAASGLMERLPLIRVVNLARAMDQLREAGFTLAGLAADGRTTPEQLRDHPRLGLVLGAEGSGLRRLTRERADLLVSITMAEGVESLNVATAAAIALYAAGRPLSTDTSLAPGQVNHP